MPTQFPHHFESREWITTRLVFTNRERGMPFATSRRMTETLMTTNDQSDASAEPGFDVQTAEVASDAATTRIVLRNGFGVEMAVLSRGCTIQSLIVPDRDGLLADVVLGFDNPAEYLTNPGYFGAIVGRYANRIAGGRFSIDDAEVQVDVNDGPNHLHGGDRGFDRQDFEAAPFVDGSLVGVRFSRRSPDGEGGFPGNLDVQVTYTLTPAGELVCEYEATTDAPTVVNISQHTYWNLAGHDVGDALDHELQIMASRFLPVDGTLIPLKHPAPVEETAFDFRAPRTIGAHIDDDVGQLRISHGYDQSFMLDRSVSDGELALAARLRESSSGRVLEIHTTEPGLHLYAGGMIPRDLPGKGGVRYRRHSGIALETQHFPDSPNRPDFPSVVVRPGATYRSRTVYRFLVERPEQ